MDRRESLGGGCHWLAPKLLPPAPSGKLDPPCHPAFHKLPQAAAFPSPVPFLTSPKWASRERERGEAGRPAAAPTVCPALSSSRLHFPPALAPAPVRSLHSQRRGARMRIEGGVAGRRTGNLETKFRAPPLASLPRRLAPRTHDPPTSNRLIGQSSLVRHVWLLQRHRYEESGSTAPAGSRAQPREGFPGSCRFETILSAECST